jgi:hypothetical protein
MDMRRGYKRGAAPDVFIAAAVRTGEVRCPMKGGIVGIEACVTIQADGNCRAYRCRYVGCSETFLVEIRRVKGDGAPNPSKRGARGRRVQEEPA